jgi:glycosyltransferase involved in cell wall biosynthesis/peptidoglycan/xylan/chitin deacetylase (PgdA/CDA1 family)
VIIHLFNSSSISGPERLVLPALATARDRFVVLNLREDRIQRLRESDPLETYAKSLQLDYGDIRVCSLWDEVAIGDLRRLLDNLNPELVHAHDVKASTYLLYALRSGSARYPIVSTHHGIAGRPDWKTRVYEHFYRKHILKSFDRAICVSTPDYEYLLKTGFPAPKLRLHLNGADAPRIDLAQRASLQRDIRARWLPDVNHRDSLFLFGVVGRLSAEKDHARLLAVLDRLNQFNTRDWRCLVFGLGPLENELREAAHRMGLDERVQWMGYRKEVGHELAGLDMLLSFSKAEGLPISLLEAGWAATPVLCTRVGGIRDVLPDDSFGTCIPSGESPNTTAWRLYRLLNESQRPVLNTQASNFQNRVASEFNQTRWLNRLGSLYAELGVGFEASSARSIWVSSTPSNGNGLFKKRLRTALFTRLLMYQSGRVNKVRDWNRSGFRILMYHRFMQDSSQAIATLAKQCAHLVRHYQPVSMTQVGESLRTGAPLPPNAVAITVDDGYRDFLFNAHPIFRAYSIPVTVYLTSGFLDGQCWLWWDWLYYILDRTEHTTFSITLSNQGPTVFHIHTKEQRQQTIMTLTEALKAVPQSDRLRILAELPELLDVQPPPTPPAAVEPLEWSEVRRLAEQGVEFGAHTCTHPILSRLESATELRDEILHSKLRIEHQLDQPVKHFAYPNGLRDDVNSLTFQILDECHFQTAVSAERGINFKGVHPYWLKRIGVEPSTSKFNLEVLVAGMGGSRSNHVPFPVDLTDEIPSKAQDAYAR